jgi:hypothetical protein
VDVDVAMSYLDFVPNRHRVWERRQAGAAQPWSEDPILRTRKFTNMFRVIDPGSQFVLTDLAVDTTPRTALARCFLYRYTNLPTTWRHLRDVLGEYPDEMDLFEEGRLVEAIHAYRDSGHKVFSGAYVILPQPNHSGDKVEQAVGLAARWMNAHAQDFLAATSQEQRFAILRREFGVGPFMAMQILTDWGYTPQCGEDREAEFVVAGPGCIKGAKFIAPTWKVEKTLEWATEHWQSTGPVLPGGRRLSRMDVQNTFCEFSKYHRYDQKPMPVREYVPAHPGAQPAPVLPAHW